MEIVWFKDFDDLTVKIDGERQPAYLIGLAPLWTGGTEEEIQDIRKEIVRRLSRCSLSAKVVARKGDRLGLSVDTFSHHKHDFPHGWDPQKYPYCATGWGAYNFNLYFLHEGLTRYEDNFDAVKNETWKDHFERVGRPK